MWYVIMVLIIDALVCAFSAASKEETATPISYAAKVICGILCILNVIAIVMLFMR